MTPVMLTLPPFTSCGLTFRLPLFRFTAERLAARFVALSSDAALIDESTCDPALLLWAACQAAQCEEHGPTSFSALDQWLRINARALFAAANPNGGREFSADEVRRIGGLMTASRSAAERVSAESRLGGDRRGSGTEAESAILASLHNAPQWLSLAADRFTRPDEPVCVLPAWLRAALARNVAKGGPVTSGTEQAIAAPADDPLPCFDCIGTSLPLVQLAGQMETLARLQDDFHRRLEVEKLEALAEFAAGAGHEINNPLAVISGRAQLLLADEQDPGRRQDLAVIHAQARRIHEMILDLMLFARPPAPRFAPVALGDVLRGLVEPFADAGADPLIEFADDLDTTPTIIDADRQQLAAALRALLDNAVRAAGAGGRIGISVRVAHDTAAARSELPIVIEIRDNGPGLDAEVRRHLFDPFFSGRTAGRGLGMGLSKCWRIVRLHGGTIDVASAAGGGTIFTIRLPTGRIGSDGSPTGARGQDALA